MFLRSLPPSLKNILILLCGFFLALAIYLMSGVIAPFLVSLVLAYIFNPLIRLLERRGLPRPWGVFTLYVFGTILGVLVVVPFGLIVIHEGQVLIQRLSKVDVAQMSIEYREQAKAFIERFAGDSALRDTLASYLTQEKIQELAAQAVASIQTFVADTIKALFSFLLSAFSSVIAIVFIPLLTFYVLMDAELIYDRAMLLVPPIYRSSVQSIVSEIDTQLSSLLRGQLVDALIFACLMSLGLWLAGMPFALLLGPIAGAANLVPYLGGLSTVVLSFLVAVTQFGLSSLFFWTMIKVAIVLSIVQSIDGFIISPKIIGKTAGLHPLVVMLALVIGGSLFGLLGMILAMPTTCILKVVLGKLYHELYDQN